MTDNEGYFREWLESGFQSKLDYLERNLDKRFDTRQLFDKATSVVVCAVSYKNRFSEGYPASFRTKIASYATAPDYHQSIKAMLLKLLKELKQHYPQLEGRAFVDTAPLLEKQLAVDAGLGWVGRQSLVVTPELGSYILLGELVLSEAVDEYDLPFEGSRCGRCRTCIDTCPTGAIIAPMRIDANRCISCYTIERRPENSINIDGWIFGCDRCQSCCPYNQKAPMWRNEAFAPVFDPLSLSKDEWLAMTEDEFSLRFGKTTLMRSGLERIKTNISGE